MIFLGIAMLLYIIAISFLTEDYKFTGVIFAVLGFVFTIIPLVNFGKIEVTTYYYEKIIPVNGYLIDREGYFKIESGEKHQTSFCFDEGLKEEKYNGILYLETKTEKHEKKLLYHIFNPEFHENKIVTDYYVLEKIKNQVDTASL